jgi:hypothetical protein
MLTRFISDQSYETVDIDYQYDSDIKINSRKIGVDGNLEYSDIPFLYDIKDLRINNYTLNAISKKDKLSNLVTINQDYAINNKMTLFYTSSTNRIENFSKFWQFQNNGEILCNTYYEYVVDKNIFQLDLLDDEICKIFYIEDTKEYVLAYSTSLSSVRFVPLSSTNLSNYKTELNYSLNEGKGIILFTKTEFGNFYLENYNNKIIIRIKDKIDENNIFLKESVWDSSNIDLTNNWISYENSFNKNNLKINKDRSHYDIENNFLISSTINSIVSSLPVNLMTLKNQLNQENDQSRGNVFLNENETNLKEYESIFTGGYRELGFDKIHLGYTSYSTPFIFKSDKTTYFHVPHNIYPYEKLNINSSKLVENGAICGNSPLNSDKIWKKLKDYKYTSPYSDPQEENSGQWLCTWLSGGSPNSKGIWLDRYYNPYKNTPFTALSASSNEIIYENSFDCLNLKEGIVDVKSSLTFEKGCYYAYMHLGINDYKQLINESFKNKIFHNKIDVYQNNFFDNLENTENEYVFDGEKFGYLDSENSYEDNVASFSFFMEKENWEIPTGNMIFGNYINGGYGFFNYLENTNYKIFKLDNTTLQITNNDFEEIDKLSTSNYTSSNIAGIARREGFDNIHVITDDFKLIEIDLKGTIVDASSAIKTTLNTASNTTIKSITNTPDYFYVDTNNKGIAAINLYNNVVTTKTIYKTITTTYTTSSFIVADGDENLYRFYGIQPIIGRDIIYARDNTNKIFYYDTVSELLSTFKTENNIICHSLDSDNNINVISDDNHIYTYDIFNNRMLKKIFLPVLDIYDLSVKNLTYCERFINGKLKIYKEIYCQKKTNNEKYIIKIDNDENQSVLKINEKYNSIRENYDNNNYTYNRSYIEKHYGKNNYLFKVRLINSINDEDFRELNFVIKKEDLATGKRHFAFSIDTYNGIGKCFLDASLYDEILFDKRKYTLSNTFKGRIFFGTNPYHNGEITFKHFKDNKDFIYGGIKISNLYIINKPIDEFECIYFYSEVNKPEDLIYNMPSGTRSFIDEIEKVFNFNIPMFKSNYFNLKILNSGIFDNDVRNKIEKEIMEKLSEYLPNYVKLNKFDWINQNTEKVLLKGDYSVSNALSENI